MLLRPQSLLLAISITCALLNVNTLPLWDYRFEDAEGLMRVFAFGRFGFGGGSVTLQFWAMNGSIGLLILFSISALLFFKNRIWQERLTALAMISSILSIGFSLFAVFGLTVKLGAGSVSHIPQVGFYLLLLIPFLLGFARSLIRKDEETASAYRRL
ncbi:MAG: DUF4293 family protein [Chloroherpetonaceae bacterium]|nr:DUF4293 family protein [Chloroherpetonaceae bacterium]